MQAGQDIAGAQRLTSQYQQPEPSGQCAEPEYADELIEHAKQMLEFGMEHSGSYMKSKVEGLVDQAKHYPSSNYNDELSWGAIWLYFATGVSRC